MNAREELELVHANSGPKPEGLVCMKGSCLVHLS